jgi:hypothetical protein
MTATHSLLAVSVAIGVSAAPVAGQEGAPAPDRELRFDFWASSFSDPPNTNGQAGQPEQPLVIETSERERLSDEWEFRLEPYLWATSLRSEIDIGPLTSTSSACFSDLLKDLDGAVQMRFEGIKGHWGFYLDGTYIGLSNDSRVRVGPFRIRGLDVDTDITEAWLDFGGMYRFGEPGCTFDLMAGGRYVYFSHDLSIGSLIDLDNSTDSVAPVVGGRVRYQLSEKWLASFKIDFSGFGVGDAADLTWGVTGLLGYQLNECTILGFGYRFYDIDVSRDHLDADIQYHGPIVGVSFKF